MKRIIAILGSTGVGKSSVANVLAGRIGGEIVVCDSLQFYRNYQVSSNWPSEEERARVNYVNLGKLDCLKEKMDTFKSNKIIRESVREVHEKGKIPVIEGGCMLSFHQFLTNHLWERDKQKLDRHKKTAKEHLQKIKDQNIGQCKTNQEWNNVCLNIQKDLELPNNSLNTMNRNDLYRLENKMSYLLYEKYEGKNQKASNDKSSEEYDSRIFVMYPYGQYMAQKIHRRCIQIIQNGYFKQIAALKKELEDKKININDITTPLGADKVMQLLTLAADPHTNQKIISKQLFGFIKTYQDITRSYHTKQKKYLQKYFKNTIWIKSTDEVAPTVQKLEKYSNLDRSQYDKQVQANQSKSRDINDFSKAKCLRLSKFQEQKIINELQKLYLKI